jgi:Fe-S-cluster containining protein
VGKNTTPAQRIPAPLPSVAAMKSRLQQATSPTEARQLIDTLVAQGLSPVAGEELTAYAAQYHEGVVALHASSDAEGVAALVDNAHAWADAMIDRSSERERRACRAGCAFCCYLPTVLVTAAEAVRLAAWLQTHCSAEELVEVRRRLLQRDAAATVSPPTKQPRPCALLRDNECMAYAVRPLKCRGWNSLRREACEQAYGQSESQVQVPADAYAFVMGNAVLNGLSDSATRSGLDGGSYDLSDALLRVLDLPDAVQRWRKGERLFDSVR